MAVGAWLREKYVYIAVVVLLAAIFWVMAVFQQGMIGAEDAKAYFQALTAIATLALLYYAYFNVASKKEEDIARLELAVRPVFIWEIESSDGGAKFAYKTIKHPLYDFSATLSLSGKKLEIKDRHLDPAEGGPQHGRVQDVTGFVRRGVGNSRVQLLSIRFSYHSEVGGKYEFHFTKEVLPKKHGFLFQHRKIVSAKYPWRHDMVSFED